MAVGNKRPVTIESEMRNSYLDYAMSVIVSRALPDVRDGLKPVQRRILYAMNDMGIRYNTAFKKSARIVGEVMGKYHPHGDSPVYEAMVRLAQNFSMRYTLVDGQGNFGSVDNDPPAAMRYTEARFTEIAEQMLVNIDSDTVDFVPNFDSSLMEPTVLPTRLPNLLVNGSSGIAVGMATNIPPHNLREVCDAMIHLIDNPDATIEDLGKFVRGPDFPTGGIILGLEGIKSAYATGHGRIVVRAKASIEEATEGGRRQIIINELPYQTNKAALVERIAELGADKKIPGISEIRDESDRQGMRVVIDLRREAQPQMVLNNLFKHTAMESAFFVNMLALVDGQPKVLSLKEAIQHFIDFRFVVITRRTRFELKQARDRAHILEGLKIALDHIDRVIAIIRQSENAEKARTALMTEFGLSQIQAQAILDMQLRRLASLERQKILDELEEVHKNIAYLESLLADPKKILALVKQEAVDLKEKFGDERRTEISLQGEVDFREEDLIPHQSMVVTISNRGFVKRVPAQLYTLQHRGGKGIIGMATREDDAVKLLTVADTHDSLLFFTNRGKAFRLRCWEITAAASRTAKGIAAINIFPIAEGEHIADVMAVTPAMSGRALLMVTERGEIKKTALDNFANVRSSGLIAMNVDAKDELLSARVATDEDDVLIVTQNGMSIRFPVAGVPVRSRTAGGVRGIRLGEGDKVVGMDIAVADALVLTVTTKGYGKLTAVEKYRLQKRAGRGTRTYRLSDKRGELVAARLVTLNEQVMIISADGIIIYTPVKEISIQGRTTQGVKLMDMTGEDQVVAITNFEKVEKAA
jgi:DNA gyrase subunit A